MLKSIRAIGLGALLAFVVVFAVEMIGMAIDPPPAGFDHTGPAALRALIASKPAWAILLVTAAWFLGTTAGAWVAARLAPRAPVTHAAAVGSLLLAAGLFNLLTLPHPAW